MNWNAEPLSTERRLIVNADDFGQSPGVNQGVIHAHRCGIVTSAPRRLVSRNSERRIVG